jgi:heptosyltransferase-2
MKQRKRILIRSVNWIGDAVLTLPAIKSIRQRFSGAYIALLARPWVAELFRNNPDIDETIIYEDRHRSAPGRYRLARTLKSYRFDSAILLQNAFDAALIAWMAGIPERSGYARDMRGRLLTNAIPPPVQNEHQVFYYLNLLNQIGIDTDEAHPFLPLTPVEKAWAKKRLARHPGDPVIVGINPGATYGSAKRWPAGRFAEVANRVIDELGGRVVIFGSPAEVEIASDIANSLAQIRGADPASLKGEESPVTIMAGKTGLRDLAALISECDALITNDSGPMHIAAALFVPVVAIFGSTDSRATGPFGKGHRILTANLPCSPCMKRECPDRHLACMNAITADDVFTALQEILPRKRAVFLDRDGTLIKDMHYLNSFENLFILPKARESMQRLERAGFMLIGVTNQSGIARGIVDEDFVIDLNAFLMKELGVNAFYYCPHHPDDRCWCRKPSALMVMKAKADHGIRLSDSYVIGDRDSDIGLALSAGTKGVMLSVDTTLSNGAHFTARNLAEAVDWILRDRSCDKIA